MSRSRAAYIIANVVFSVLALFISTGCGPSDKEIEARRAEVNKALNSWVGSHYSELIKSWGAPQQIMDDGKGGKIIVYEEYCDLGTIGNVDRRGNIHTQDLGYSRRREFYTDDNGVIDSWRWRGW
jgi:hypothetical protein